MFQLIFSHSATKIRHRNKCHSCLTRVCLFSYLIVQGDILCSCFLTPTDHVLPYQKLSCLIGDHNSDGTRRTPTCATAGGAEVFPETNHSAQLKTQKLNPQVVIQFHFSFFYLEWTLGAYWKLLVWEAGCVYTDNKEWSCFIQKGCHFKPNIQLQEVWAEKEHG